MIGHFEIEELQIEEFSLTANQAYALRKEVKDRLDHLPAMNEITPSEIDDQNIEYEIETAGGYVPEFEQSEKIISLIKNAVIIAPSITTQNRYCRDTSTIFLTSFWRFEQEIDAWVALFRIIASWNTDRITGTEPLTDKQNYNPLNPIIRDCFAILLCEFFQLPIPTNLISDLAGYLKEQNFPTNAVLASCFTEAESELVFFIQELAEGQTAIVKQQYYAASPPAYDLSLGV